MSELKNLFTVKNADGSTRLSEAMIANMVVLVASLALIFGVELSDGDTAAITAAIMSVGGIILRLRSPGGTIKIKEPEPLKLDDDEWGI